VSSDKAYLTFLGTGTSVGVPVIGCVCQICKSADPRNNRTRSSILVSSGNTAILVDSGPDLREQALREGISSIDAVLYTHSHLDHVVGFDELRAFCWGKPDPLPLYATESCLGVLRNMFSWAFHEQNTHSGYVKPDPRILSPSFNIGGVRINPLPVIHGGVETVGYLFETEGGFRTAYMPDVKSIPAETIALLGNLDLLVIDSLRDTPHPTHLSVKETLAISESLTPRRTLMTHISHDLDHAELSARLPAGIGMAYDGLRIQLA
jgi:phosphoribosyl 1,2-cyclic phosphate phosphodiesterase